ncbi:hypothetical protein BC829DRAFT_195870 [Chytridium lagenaria]|nr:hypothetical protein BC829DRAFT_195870 [Chytridium lagenaria]
MLLSSRLEEGHGKCFLDDTYVGVVSGYPLAIEESINAYLITGRRNTAPSVPLDDNDTTARAAGQERWKQCLSQPPTQTLFHDPRHPEILPALACTYSFENHLAIVQLAFLLRRVVRLNYSFRQTPLPNPEDMDARMQIVGSLIEQPRDGREIHDALVDWHAALPDHLRAFDTLEDLVPKFMPSLRTVLIP